MSNKRVTVTFTHDQLYDMRLASDRMAASIRENYIRRYDNMPAADREAFESLIKHWEKLSRAIDYQAAKADRGALFATHALSRPT